MNSPTQSPEQNTFTPNEKKSERRIWWEEEWELHKWFAKASMGGIIGLLLGTGLCSLFAKVLPLLIW